MSLNADRLHDAISRVARRDPQVRRAVAEAGLPAPRIHAPGFAALLRIMVSQQLSVKAAATINERLAALLGETTPDSIRAQPDDALRAAGLSRQKVAYARALAEASHAGVLDFSTIGRLGDEDAITRISSVKGFGRWSAEIYLMFCKGRPDIWPAADLGLQAGLHRLKALDARPGPGETVEIVEPWRPHRSAMAIFLWHYYGKTATPMG